MLLLALAALSSAAEPTLHVETWNVGLATGFVDHAAARRPLIVDALAGSEADVICLQEVWAKKERKDIRERLLGDYPYSVVPDVEVRRADKAPACKRKDLFGEGKFVSCMSEQCGDLSGDAHTDCIITRCDQVLDRLRTDNPSCAQALFSQVGRGSLSAVMALLSPFRAAKTYAYDGSNGLMLLSRRPLENVDVLDFTDIATLNRRQALIAEVEVGNGDKARVYCTHLTADLATIAPYPGSFDGWSEENRAQIDRLTAHAGATELPTVILGDFNCGTANPEAGLAPELPGSCQAVLDAGWRDSAPATPDTPCTWCADNLLNAEEGDDKNALIDHVFVSGLVPVDQGRRYDQAVEIEVKGEDGKARIPMHLSDHFGYGVVLEVGDPPVPEPVEASSSGGEEEEPDTDEVVSPEP